MSSKEQQFSQLCQHVRETTYLQSTMALLEWDQQTQLPSTAGEYRAEQVTFLAGEVHRRQTDPVLLDLLNELNQNDEISSEPSGDFATTVRELKRDCEKKQKLPARLVQELASATSMGQQTWIQARKENDFSQFAPVLERIFQLKREQCDAIGFDGCRYDVLLDDYEPDCSTENVAKVLQELKAELVPLVAQIATAQRRPDPSVLSRNFPVESQRKFATEASTQIGFDYNRGRLDVTHHPFCTEIGPDDVRITTRFDESFFNMAFFGTLHEAGHGIYEQGLRGDQYGLPPGKYCSLGIHESQSRLWENLVGRSRGFWNHFYGSAQSHFSAALSDVSLDDFYGAINTVSPSLIRVEADEATYNLHIIIRFELENALLNDELKVGDLPAAWSESYREMLGVAPDSDADGVLQDIHWSAGLIGYFPTYTLGNIYASQLFDCAESELGDLEKMFSAGEFLPLKNWLNEHVHARGQRDKPERLIEGVVGSGLSHENLVRHLKTKLVTIYGL